MTYEAFTNALPALLHTAEGLIDRYRGRSAHMLAHAQSRTAYIKYARGSDMPMGCFSPNPVADKLPGGPRRGRPVKPSRQEGLPEWIYRCDRDGRLITAECSLPGRERIYHMLGDIDGATFALAYAPSGDIADVRAWLVDAQYELRSGEPAARMCTQFEVSFGGELGPCALCDAWVFACEGGTLARFEHFLREAYPERARALCKAMGMTLLPEEGVRSVYTLCAVYENGLASYTTSTVQGGSETDAGSIMIRRPPAAVKMGRESARII